jgi:hypothetical protein
MLVHAQTLWVKVVAVDGSVQVSQRKAYELRVVLLGSNSLPYSGLACHQHRGKCSGLINGHWHWHWHNRWLGSMFHQARLCARCSEGDWCFVSAAFVLVRR